MYNNTKKNLDDCVKELLEQEVLKINECVEHLKTKNIEPKLYVITDGKDESCKRYMKSKIGFGEELGIKVVPITVKNKSELKDVILEANTYNIPCMIELPIEKSLYEYYSLKIKPRLDMDGLLNIQSWYNKKSEVIPATPKGCLKLLKSFYDKDLSKILVVIVGRGETVGKPLSVLFTNEKVHHIAIGKNTDKYIREVLLKSADCVICCSGVRNSILEKELSIVNPPIIINIGICFDEQGKLIEEFLPKDKDIQYTKKRGGMGLITTTQLFSNIIEVYKNP